MVEKFSLITAVICKIKMNWAKFLFGVLKKMVSAGSKQAKGFAIQISMLLETFPSVDLGESSEFPESKVLTKKTVLRFVSINDRDGAEEVIGGAKKKAVSKKRPAADVGAAVPKKRDLSAALADFQAALSEQMFAFQSEISSRMHKIEKSVCDSLRDQAEIFRNLSQRARQEVRTIDHVHTIRFNEFRKNVLTQNASIFQGLADVRQVVEAVNAKVDIMASRVIVIQKDAEATKEALSHQLLEFQSSAQENHNVIHAQLSELVDYIHRGSADKKGESGSRGLQKPANTQKEGSAVTPSFEQRVQMAQRGIVQTVLDADANRDAAERDRERRRNEAKSLKRRRKD
ncbi:jacalin-like lectin domain-containing protein [Dorcoceras hygrometricum]|uniref:Jacalin-like lectin domain-containing protein n=1 Tax=Dorcoceras hygrometricum TaxID=472368 RepID=A0A2Z7D946_9LAMI|nr:jacalin-like lectin domain-containing protein [Dorcoceras hygrometricum]